MRSVQHEVKSPSVCGDDYSTWFQNGQKAETRVLLFGQQEPSEMVAKCTECEKVALN